VNAASGSRCSRGRERLAERVRAHRRTTGFAEQVHHHEVALAAARGTVVVAGAVTGVAIAGGDDGRDGPITGTAPVKAEEAALAHTGGGEVTETEVGDEQAYYEVAVTLPDGSQVDVQLDRDFDVVGGDPDAETDD
jgi:hypothetical protein